MPSIKSLRAPLVLTFGSLLASVAFAAPAGAADSVYPPRVLGTSVTSNSGVPTNVPAANETAGASELAFTGANAVGVGAFGGLLLVGGAALVLGTRRRKVNV